MAMGPPLILLGAATPFLVRGALRDGKVGRAAGLISGAATIGSLLGTWLPVYVLIPSLGSKATCLFAGCLIALGGVITLIGSRSVRNPAVMLAFVLTGSLFALGMTSDGNMHRGASREGVTVLAELETRYQYARVERLGSRTELKLNEGLDSFHSLTIEDQDLTDGAYFDYYGLFLPAATREAKSAEVLVLGFAAGTIARELIALYGEDWDLRITGVELDPEVAKLGTEFFRLPDDPRIEIISDQDARVYIDRSSRRFDLIIVDTYSNQIYVPFQTCSLEFFESVWSHLRPGGILTANLSGFSSLDAPVAAIANTAARVFHSVVLVRVQTGRNFVLAAQRDGIPTIPQAALIPEDLHPVLEAASSPGSWIERLHDGEGVVLTDDQSAIELLADRDLIRRAARQSMGLSDE